MAGAWKKGGKWGSQTAGVRERSRKVHAHCDRSRGEVSDAQLIQEIGDAYEKWLERRHPEMLIDRQVARSGEFLFGRNRIETITTAAEAYRAAGYPVGRLKEFSVLHGVKYRSLWYRVAQMRRREQEQQRACA